MAGSECESVSHRTQTLRHAHSPPRRSPWPGCRFLGPCLPTTASPPTARAGAGAWRCGSPRRILSAARCRSAPRTLWAPFRLDFTAQRGQMPSHPPKALQHPLARAFRWRTVSPVCPRGSPHLARLLLLRAPRRPPASALPGRACTALLAGQFPQVSAQGPTRTRLTESPPLPGAPTASRQPLRSICDASAVCPPPPPARRGRSRPVQRPAGPAHGRCWRRSTTGQLRETEDVPGVQNRRLTSREFL